MRAISLVCGLAGHLRSLRSSRSRFRVAALGLGVGILLGLMAAGASVAVSRARLPQAAPAGGIIDATHLPPTLVAPDEPVALRYDITCPPPVETEGSGCAGSGTVYLRAGQSGAFSPLPLTLDPDAAESRYSVVVPPEIAAARDGFSYYAILRDESSGATITLPPGGSGAPQQALPFVHPVEVALDPVDLASTEAPTAEVARARWGDGPADAGLEDGKQSRMGAASFAISPTGDVVLLDEAHRRLLRWTPGASAPSPVPLEIAPVQSDLAIAGDGSLYVLQSPYAGSPRPLLRAFDRSGRALASAALDERTAVAIEAGDDSVFTLSYPGGRWLPSVSGVGSGRPTVVPEAARQARASVGRPASGGRQVLLLRDGQETRLALASAKSVLRSWRLTSSVNLGEIQLAKPLGNGVIVVAHPNTQEHDQFLVLLLGPKGVVRRFGVASASWAETAPLSRFRLVGTSLYQLGSDESAVFVDRFDLGGIS